MGPLGRHAIYRTRSSRAKEYMRYPACHESLSSIALMNRFSRASGNLRDHLRRGRGNIPGRVPAMGSGRHDNCHWCLRKMGKVDGSLDAYMRFKVTATKTMGWGFAPWSGVLALGKQGRLHHHGNETRVPTCIFQSLL